MNVFVLNTGRCGSTTFIMACRHITNYTAAHESRSQYVGAARLDYPPNHIEADNRLSWFLGRLDRKYGNDAFYVHLRRDERATAQSWVRRYDRNIMKGYREYILMGFPGDASPYEVARDYIDTVNSNIELFLRDKTNWMDLSIERAQIEFPVFWERIGARGDLAAALAEFDTLYNASGSPAVKERRLLSKRAVFKAARIVRKLPKFIRYA